jgi:two-component SAPR family response regulator
MIDDITHKIRKDPKDASSHLTCNVHNNKQGLSRVGLQDTVINSKAVGEKLEQRPM